MFERISKLLSALKEFFNPRFANISVSVGDITDSKVDAIVNAANSELQAGGGVCGAIFKKAGYEQLQAACDEYNGCPTGGAVITPGFNLGARHIIHAVGPIYQPGRDNKTLLRSAYQESLKVAADNGLKSIAFPAISTGIYGYPLEDATEVAIQAVQDFCNKDSRIERVDFVCFSEDTAEVYKRKMSYLNDIYTSAGMSI